MFCNVLFFMVKFVERCLRNDLEWKVRVVYVSCLLVEQFCVESDMFVYYCVLNVEGIKWIEVCVLVKFIYGKCSNQKLFVEKCFFSQYVGNFILYVCLISREINVDCLNKQRILVLVEGC